MFLRHWCLKANKHVEDDLLARELKEQSNLRKIPPNDAEKFFRMCLTGRLPKSAKYLIAQDKRGFS